MHYIGALSGLFLFACRSIQSPNPSLVPPLHPWDEWLSPWDTVLTGQLPLVTRGSGRLDGKATA